MYIYGINYWKLEDNVRVPDTGLDVRLVRPGASWESGLQMQETGVSGFYGIMTDVAAELGYYEIWDNRSTTPSFSGKCCFIGTIDTAAIKPAAITTELIRDGAVTSQKIGLGSIIEAHFSNLAISMQSIAHEVQNEYHGVGKESNATPALYSSDKTITHILERSYKKEPLVYISNKSNGHIFVNSVDVESGVATITLGVGANFGDKDQASYNIIVIDQ